VRDIQIKDLSARLGLARHQQAAHYTRTADVDLAFDELTAAARAYADAGDLPAAIVKERRRLAVDPDTDQVLLSSLCPDCRGRLTEEEGASVREHLRHALYLVPRDLPWFVSCCDDCYRVVWKAFGLARLGLMNDAWKAWWLVAHADLADFSDYGWNEVAVHPSGVAYVNGINFDMMGADGMNFELGSKAGLIAVVAPDGDRRSVDGEVELRAQHVRARAVDRQGDEADHQDRGGGIEGADRAAGVVPKAEDDAGKPVEISHGEVPLLLRVDDNQRPEARRGNAAGVDLQGHEFEIENGA